MELYWYIIVIIFIIVKIFFYICWYRSRQRQLDAYLSNPRNAQIVIVGGRAYLHQICEQQNNEDKLSPRVVNLWNSLPQKAVEANSLDVLIPEGNEQGMSPMWYSWYGGQDDASLGEPSGTLPPAPSYSQLEVPPPYDMVPSGQTDDLKPPPYTEHATGSIEEACALSIPEGYDACSLSDAPPPYTPSPTVEITQQNTVMLSGAQESDNASSADSPCQV